MVPQHLQSVLAKDMVVNGESIDKLKHIGHF